MRRNVPLVILSMGVLCVFGNVLSAAPFEPLFQVTDLEGKCLVKIPGAATFGTAERGKVYAYGGMLKTDKKGSATIQLSAGNQCMLAAMTACRLDEGQIDPTRKSLTLDYGRVDVKLEEEFHAANGFQVRTAVAICDAIGCEFTSDAQSEGDMDITTHTCSEGKLKITGPNFAIPLMDKDDVLTISTAKDKSFTRLETVEGAFDVEVKDAQSNPKTVPTQKGSVIKIWRRASESEKMLIVTILIVGADEVLQEAITYTEPIPEDGGPRPPDEPPLTTTTTTTTTTTSTTFPSPTPVGLR